MIRESLPGWSRPQPFQRLGQRQLCVPQSLDGASLAMQNLHLTRKLALGFVGLTGTALIASSALRLRSRSELKECQERKPRERAIMPAPWPEGNAAMVNMIQSTVHSAKLFVDRERGWDDYAVICS